MTNHHRGEIEAELDDKKWTLCLTLGSLAEIETAYKKTDFLAIAERFETGHIGASDAIKLIAAGLRGAGHQVTNEEVAQMRVKGGVAAYVDIVVRLLNATFVPAQQ